MKKLIFVCLFSLFGGGYGAFSSSSPFSSLSVVEDVEKVKKSYIKFTAHNVGQGNCMVAELYDSGTKETSFLLMDAGSSAFTREVSFRDHFREKNAFKKADSEEASGDSDVLRSSLSVDQKSSSSFDTPKSSRSDSSKSLLSIKKKPSPSSLERLGKRPREVSSETSKNQKKIIKNIRTSLSKKDKKDKKHSEKSINVKTIFVSHPDIDHYNWVEEIFTNKKDRIENIILGGLPENYNKKFINWLKDQPQATNIYFPAILCDQPIKSLDDVLLTTSGGKMIPEGRLYAPQMYSDPVNGWVHQDHLNNFEKALPFTDSIKTYLLSVNPTHWPGRSGVIRSCLTDDDNSDSLSIKLQIGNQSVIITGDATNITTGRILDNYSDSEGFLKGTTALTASHHGSYTHGSNDERWIQAVSPHSVVFSCGLTHNHPGLEVYERFKRSPHLITHKKAHEIWVWSKQSGDKAITATLHETYRSIFSTFNSDAITFKLYGDETSKIKTSVNSHKYQITQEFLDDSKDNDDKKILVLKGDDLSNLTEKDEEDAETNDGSSSSAPPFKKAKPSKDD